jgi:cardiolipin synthase
VAQACRTLGAVDAFQQVVGINAAKVHLLLCFEHAFSVSLPSCQLAGHHQRALPPGVYGYAKGHSASSMKHSLALVRLCLRAGCVLALCLLTGCAALPDVRYLNERLTPVDDLTIKNASGALTPEQAAALLKKRIRSARLNVTELAALEEAATGRPLIADNEVSLLFDGPETMEAMMAAISGARDHINLETYIFDQDELGIRFSGLLIAKQREGVQVNIIYDSVGTIGTPEAFFQRMRDAGIMLHEFNPVNPLKRFKTWQVNNRDHRKILVVDGKIAFTGGINITGDYDESSMFRSGGRKDPEKVGWRDTHLQIEGPAVAAIQWLFIDTWTEQSNQVLTQRDYFPPLSAAGNKMVRVLGSEPGGDFEIYKSYILAIQQASKTIHITTPYFVPDQQLVDSLTDAARRGVDVKIVFPSVIDAELVWHAGRSFYTELLQSGVRIFEMQIAILHAKTAVIDGVWSTVGSANLDMRSFLHNHEVNVVVIGADFGKAMENAFAEDMRNTVEIHVRDWEQRSIIARIKEWTARRLAYWL